MTTNEKEQIREREKKATPEPIKKVIDMVCEEVFEFPLTNENVNVAVRRIKTQRNEAADKCIQQRDKISELVKICADQAKYLELEVKKVEGLEEARERDLELLRGAEHNARTLEKRVGELINTRIDCGNKITALEKQVEELRKDREKLQKELDWRNLNTDKKIDAALDSAAKEDKHD